MNALLGPMMIPRHRNHSIDQLYNLLQSRFGLERQDLSQFLKNIGIAEITIGIGRIDMTLAPIHKRKSNDKSKM